MGAVLLKRNNHWVKPTEQGRALIRQGEDLLDCWEHTAGKLDADSAHKYTCRSFLEFFDCYLKKTKEKPDLTSDDVITVTEFAPDVK